MATCKLYKGPQLLGDGTLTSGSTSITSWTATADTRPVARRNVSVTITSSTHTGSTFQTKVMADNGSGTLTLRDPSPFAT